LYSSYTVYPEKWYSYLKARQSSSVTVRSLIYNKALKDAPRSYKLWILYLKENEKTIVDGHSKFDSTIFTQICYNYERALLSMSKMPLLWIEYLRFRNFRINKTSMRRIFDRALQALPIGQHQRIWTLYLKFLRFYGYPHETIKRLYTRYLLLREDKIEEYVIYLKNVGDWNKATNTLLTIIVTESFQSMEAKTLYQLWIELCDIVTKHQTNLLPAQVETLIRSGISNFNLEEGRMWVSIADYYVRQGYFERARDLYEEGLAEATTIKDFNIIFDAYALFNQSILKLKFNLSHNDSKRAKGLATSMLKENEIELDICRVNFEHLMKRRPYQLSSVILCQNPSNVFEWMKRIQLFTNQPRRQISIFLEALSAVDPHYAIGKISSLWCAFANFYEIHHDISNARLIFSKAVSVSYPTLNDIVDVYCKWVEMELRHDKKKVAQKILRIALWTPTNFGSGKLSIQKQIYGSTILWNLLSDVEESYGSLERVREVHNRMTELKVGTPQNVINFAQILIDNNLHEEAFQVYERGLRRFRNHHSMDIWLLYISQFIKTYRGEKKETTRKVFEQALISIPREGREIIYLLYAQFEENFGTLERSISIYKRSVFAVPREGRLRVYEMFIQKASLYSGISGVREVFEIAIQSREPYHLQAKSVLNLCLRYADLECSLGELVRARAIYIHATRFIDHRTDQVFWRKWGEFEVTYGNETSFRDLLRIKRSIKASFASSTNLSHA